MKELILGWLVDLMQFVSVDVVRWPWLFGVAYRLELDYLSERISS